MKMVKLKIENKNNYVYNLVDETGHMYIINFQFLDILEQPEIGNYIYIHKQLLDPLYDGYSTHYTFGNLQNKYGKENISIDDIDILKIVTGQTETYLKRLYG